MNIRRSDWVQTLCGSIGFVIRVAKDNSWADVRWHMNDLEWSKRMPTSSLTILTTIPISRCMTVTDMAREKELVDE